MYHPQFKVDPAKQNEALFRHTLSHFTPERNGRHKFHLQVPTNKKDYDPVFDYYNKHTCYQVPEMSAMTLEDEEHAEKSFLVKRYGKAIFDHLERRADDNGGETRFSGFVIRTGEKKEYAHTHHLAHEDLGAVGWELAQKGPGQKSNKGEKKQRHPQEKRKSRRKADEVERMVDGHQLIIPSDDEEEHPKHKRKHEKAHKVWRAVKAEFARDHSDEAPTYLQHGADDAPAVSTRIPSPEGVLDPQKTYNPWYSPPEEDESASHSEEDSESQYSEPRWWPDADADAGGRVSDAYNTEATLARKPGPGSASSASSKGKSRELDSLAEELER